MRQAGRNTQFGFFDGSPTSVKLICAGKDSGGVDKQFAGGQPCDGLSLSRLADQGLNPTEHKFLTPPPARPKKSGSQVRGGGGRGPKIEKFIEGPFCLTK